MVDKIDKIDVSQIQAFAKKVMENVEQVIVGKRAAVELTVVGLLSQGHLLIEDVPGVGKTMLAKNMAHRALLAGHTVMFTTASAMLNDLALSWDGPTIQITYFDEAGMTGDIYLTGVTGAIPEPATMALLAGGAVALLRRRGR